MLKITIFFLNSEELDKFLLDSNLNSIKISIEFAALTVTFTKQTTQKVKEKVAQQKNLSPCFEKILYLKVVDRAAITLPSKHSAVSKVGCLAAKSRAQRK